ncbi:hypothetical protein SELMODRAFT_431628 [Selaginella moellendorffii]|uniref:Uncharacterized protein n=1 Tax=Selaginella moellendorffii TaxID=88036 RepID=D8TD97_SELML|nr:hypothetical protein SELMODRAFT_431628 [Selaginella moellendorffii]
MKTCMWTWTSTCLRTCSTYTHFSKRPAPNVLGMIGMQLPYDKEEHKRRILAPVFPIRPDSKVSASHKRSPGAGCELWLGWRLEKLRRILFGLRLNLIPKYMYNPAVALRDTVIELEVAIEGGKDSLSMAAQADITLIVTPDLKIGEEVVLLLGLAKLPLCGLVILAWTLKYLKRAFNATQGCMKNWAFQVFYTMQKGIILFNQKPCMSLNRGRIRVGNVKSGWKIMVMIFITAATDRDSGIMHLAFELESSVLSDSNKHQVVLCDFIGIIKRQQSVILRKLHANDEIHALLCQTNDPTCVVSNLKEMSTTYMNNP